MATQTNNIPLPFPSARDMDNITNTVKQLVSLPAMGVSQMIDSVNNINKSFVTQMQAAIQNMPNPVQIFPMPVNPMTTGVRVVPVTQSNGPITAAQVVPKKNDEEPLTV